MSGTLPNEFKIMNQDPDDPEDEDDNTRGGSTGAGEEEYDTGGSRTNLMTRSSNPVSNCVQVALRIRPLLPREVIANSRECITVTPGEPQVFIGGGHAFTYDYVFGTAAPQDEIFCSVAKPLVDGILQGYNATILAYGQTGSGKTYTMGTGFDPSATLSTSNTTGLLPRCITYLFQQISTLKSTVSPPPDFKVAVQFTELYNEEVIDLLSDSPIMISSSSRPGTARNNVKIHEQANGQIYLVNINTKPVRSDVDTLETLREGALNRTTASTNMNDSSSRSHAIFSIMVTQNKVVVDRTTGQQDIETLHGKFHFVDLAGSERLKRTLATGDRAREGIAINSGLLALGNVISALGDKAKKALHVPYRDSKLTRLLQDSLGGNSRTLMIACVSPNELDFVETLNTMKYANRAKNIKNKVVLNQDKSSRTISLLRDEIASLQAELNEYKRGVKSTNEYDCGDVNAENIMLLAEVETLRCKVKGKQDCIDQLTSTVARLQACKISNDTEGGEHSSDFTLLISKYLREIEELRAKLYESEMECEKLRGKHRVIMKNLTSPRESNTYNSPTLMTESVNDLLNKAKQEVEEDVNQLNRASSDEDETSEDDSEYEQQNNSRNYNELANLTQEINTKQRLIEELENSQLRLESLKNKYEEKVQQLGNKIKCTEQERDAVLKNSAPDKTREYETKIKELQAELKKWANAKKEHAKMMRSQSQYETQINKLKNEVDEMKRVKVRLMNQVKQDSAKHRELEKQRVREITQLRKESRMKEIRVRKLESDSRLKDQVLKRKLEEVEMLKRNRANKSSVLNRGSPVKGKQVWGKLQGMLMKDVSVRQSTAMLEREMVGLIARRSELNMLMEAEVDKDVADSIRANLQVVEEKIRDVQDEIVRGGGDTASNTTTSRRVSTMVVGELAGMDLGYLVEKLYDQSVTGMSDVQMLEGRVKEVEEVNRHLSSEVETLRELLHHMYSHHRSESVEPPPPPPQLMGPPLALPPPQPSQLQNNNNNNMKARRRLTSTTQELLGSAESIDLLENQPPQQPARNTFTRNTRLTQSMRGNSTGDSSLAPPPLPGQRRKLTRQDTYSLSDNNTLDRTFTISSSSNTNNEVQAPPNQMQRSISEIGDNSGSNSAPTRRKSPRSNAWLQLTRSLEGHSKQILCLAATEDTLVSGSKDGSCRVWDLETGKCVHEFDGHPHNVSCVCHVEDSSVVLTGSSYTLRVCDLRVNQVVKVISSSGQVLPSSSLQSSQPPIPSLPQSTLPRVNDLPPGEKSIFSIQQVRNYFFTSCGERTKIWDLRKFTSIGLLQGKHNANIMCLTGKSSWLRQNDFLISGSKDHTLKVYEYGASTPPEQIKWMTPLNPPHYDGIECLYLSGDSTLFSGSRDTCIKKWDLGSMRMVSSVTNAHSGWVTGVCGVPGGNAGTNQDFLVSCSRDGTLKLWDLGGGNNEFREVCRYESNIGLECVTGNSRFLFFGGGASSAAGAVLCCTVNERALERSAGDALLPPNLLQQHYYSRGGGGSSSSSSRLNLISPVSSPKFRRKYLHSNLLQQQQHHHGSIDNIMTRSTGGVDFLEF